MPVITETIDERFQDAERAAALAKFLECRWTEIEEIGTENLYGEGHEYSANGGEWAVLTEDEADAAWDNALDRYIEECLMPELPEMLQNYFDGEAWKRDARMDGRGHCLSCYDGNEWDQDGYLIYRTN